MRYNLIIVACSANKNLIKITEECIASAKQDEADLEITVVETSGKLYPYDANIIPFMGAFNYNRALNIGINASRECDIYILANNDIKFHKGWSHIGGLMVVNEFGSASALSGKRSIEPGAFIYEGYQIGTLLTGWCIFATSGTIKTIGGIDESYDFWCSDNVYADQLKKAGIRHGLFCNIRVDHIESATLKTVPLSTRRKYTLQSLNKYKNGS